MNHRHIPAWLTPAPDSVVADNLKLGKWPWIDAVHLLWTVWEFLTPMFGGGFTLRWVLIVIALIGIAVTIHARLDDWKRGQR